MRFDIGRRQSTPLKKCLREIREARNGVHAHLFDKNLVTLQTVANVAYVVESKYSFLETNNAPHLMKHLHKRGDISHAEY
jgi:hypothetical protein